MRRLIVIALVLAACSPSQETLEVSSSSTTTTSTTSTTIAQTTVATAAAGFAVSSPAFDDGERIPTEYTCDGGDVSPQLRIVGIPEGTESLVLVVDDPDAPLGTWDHWVEFDIVTGPGSMSIERASGPVGVQGVNSWRVTGYMGPCPPEGEEHGYHFTVHALSDLLDLPEESTSDQVYSAMEGIVIETVELTGTYSR